MLAACASGACAFSGGCVGVVVQCLELLGILFVCCSFASICGSCSFGMGGLNVWATWHVVFLAAC